MKKGGRATGMKGPDGKNIIKAEGHFTNAAVPRFDGGRCWQQHLQIFQAFVKSNGWTDGTAALQLFAHLDGEALNIALLIAKEERGEGVFLMQTPGTWGEPIFAGGHFFFRSCCRAGRWMSGMAYIERYGQAELECGLLRETRDGPGGRVSLPDHWGPKYD